MAVCTVIKAIQDEDQSQVLHALVAYPVIQPEA